MSFDNYNEPKPFVANIANAVKINPSYRPVQGERLSSYLARLGQHINHIENVAVNAHMYSKKGPWYTHSQAGDCFICVQIQFSNTLYDILKQVADQRKTDMYFALKGGIMTLFPTDKRMKS